MFLRKLLGQGSREARVIQGIQGHLKLLQKACRTFDEALQGCDKGIMHRIVGLEREGDAVRREIISHIYEGAFLPYIRGALCRFVESADRVFDILHETARNYMDLELPDGVCETCARIAYFNVQICDMLTRTFDAMVAGEDLREKVLAIRIYEKRIDDIKIDLLKTVRQIPVENFWQGMLLSDFIAGLTSISDLIEDTSDHLQILSVSLQ